MIRQVYEAHLGRQVNKVLAVELQMSELLLTGLHLHVNMLVMTSHSHPETKVVISMWPILPTPTTGTALTHRAPDFPVSWGGCEIGGPVSKGCACC